MTKQVTEELIHQIAGMLKAAGWHAKADRQWEGLRAVIQHIARELTDEPCEPLPSMPIVCRQCGSTDTMPWPHSSVKSQGASRDASSDDPNKVNCVICGKLWGEHSAQEQADCSAAL